MGSIFFELTIIICLASILAIFFRILKQPPMFAYIVTALLLGPLSAVRLHNFEVFRSLSDVGITLLLFLFGLELKFSDLKSIGRVAIFSGLIQIVTTFLLAFGISSVFGLGQTAGFYVAACVTLSSTVILLKLLSEKGDNKSLYGKLAIGISLVQDFFAIAALILLSGYTPSVSSDFITQFLSLCFKSVILLTTIIWLGRVVLPRVMHIIARSQEILFLVSLAWVFGVAALVSSPFIGFSIEIGGFVAGLALANSLENFEIIAKMRPLRDFFVIMFFIFLGMEMGIGNVGEVIFPAIVLSLFALSFKPFIVYLSITFFGYRKRTAFLSGSGLGQLSEFSLILILLAYNLHYVTAKIVSLVTLTCILSFLGGTYIFVNKKYLYRVLESKLPILRKTKNIETLILGEFDMSNHVILVGGTRMGESILKSLGDNTENVIVVDFDPKVIERLRAKGTIALFGDIMDREIQELINIDKAKLIISTMSDFEYNALLIKMAHQAKKRVKVIVMAYDPEEAKILYNDGADYVVLPHIAGGKQIARTIKSDELDKLEELREKDKIYLQ